MSIQQLINQALRKKYEEKRETSGKFAPYLLGRCFRNQIWAKAGIKSSNPPDDRVLRIFKVGSLFHDFIQNFLPEHQIEVKCETDDFKGRADIVTEDSVYDVKSVHSQSFWYMNKPNYDIKTEKFHNWLQLTYYAWVLKKEKIVLVQISKDDLCINEYVDFTSKWLDTLQTEVDQLRWYDGIYEKGELPTAEPRFNKECKYCNYLDLCKKEEENGDRIHPNTKLLKNSQSRRRSRKSTTKVATS